MKLRTIIKAVSFAAAIWGVLDLALTKREEQKGDFTREFPDAQEEIIKAVKAAGGKINE